MSDSAPDRAGRAEPATLAELATASLRARTRHDEASRKLKDVLESGTLYPTSIKCQFAIEAWHAAVDYHTAVMREGQARTAEVQKAYVQLVVENRQLKAQNEQAQRNEKRMTDRIKELERDLRAAERKAKRNGK